MGAPIDNVFKVLREFKPSYEQSAAEIVIATVIANQFKGPPVWLMLVAAPSAGKTVVLEPLEFLPNSILLSKMTNNTLLSGAADRNGSSSSLLLRLGNKPMIVIKDLGQMLQASRVNNNIVFDQLRDVYDGVMKSSYGIAGKDVRWPEKTGEKGKATVIVGMTPAVDLYSEMSSALGERFIRYRFSNQHSSGIDHRNAVKAAMRRAGDEDKFTVAMAKAYTQCVRDCSKARDAEAEFAGEATLELLADLTEFLRHARATVSRNKWRHDEVNLAPEAEFGYRLGKTLWMLANALCILRDTTEIEDAGILEQICFDTIAEPRRSILLELVEATRSGKLLQKRDFKTEVSKSVIYRTLQDLELLKMIEGTTDEETEGRGRPPTLWGVTPKFMEYLP